jgi:hypothetical protein
VIGHDFDLGELPKLFTADDLRVVRAEGKFLLEAERLDELTDSSAVHAAASDLLPLMNGVPRLRFFG